MMKSMSSIAIDMAKTFDRGMGLHVYAFDDFLSKMRQELYSSEKITIEVSP